MQDNLPKLTSKEMNAVVYYCTTCIGNKSAAYRKAYDCKNSSEKTIWKEASKLFNSPRVTPWIDYYNKVLEKHNEEEIKYTRTEFMEDLMRIRAKTEDSSKTVGVALRATELMGKASGLLKENNDNSASVVVNMGTIQKDDGKTVEFIVGENATTSNS